MDAASMDAVQNLDNEANVKNVVILNFHTNYPVQRNTIVKYTKLLPEYDFDAKASWNKNSYVLPARLRRIISINEQPIPTNRTLRFDTGIPRSVTCPISTKNDSMQKSDNAKRSSNRKVVSLIEDNKVEHKSSHEQRLKRPTFSNKSVSANSSTRAKDRENHTSYLATPRNPRTPIKYDSTFAERQSSSTPKLSPKWTPKVSDRNFQTSRTNSNIQKVKKRDSTLINKKKCAIPDPTLTNKKNCAASKINLSKKPPKQVVDAEVEFEKIKSKMMKDMKYLNPLNKPINFDLNKSKLKLKEPALNFYEVKRSCTPYTIHVPLEDAKVKKLPLGKNRDKDTETETVISAVDASSGPDCDKECSTNVDSQTDILLGKVNKITEIEQEYLNVIRTVDEATSMNCHVNELENKSTETLRGIDKILEMEENDKSIEMKPFCFEAFNSVSKDHEMDHTDIRRDISDVTLDSLNIPNVSLTKEKSDLSNHLCSKSLPNLKIPKIIFKGDKENPNVLRHKSSSYIIRQATLTYTKEINVHLIGNQENIKPDAKNHDYLVYPVNVVSVLKNEMKNNGMCEVPPLPYRPHFEDSLKERKLYCKQQQSCPSYIFDSDKLVKPSDIISSMGANTDLLQSDFVSEQFHKELNFIDSFFESLQYLESSSLSETCLSFNNSKIKTWMHEAGFNLKDPDYDSIFSNLEDETTNDESETIASKSLCLLNLLIRDEQRRAKNLLLILKMRENALKDFTTSQIIWLENKKKQDNIDISALKKRQRGALLKLQHECGEMQRMRKALLALSEKRKLALMKTKKSIELKQKNNVDVERLALGKKKLKRNITPDRNPTPLKCFDLSSSGGDESSRSKSDTLLNIAEVANTISEKSIQTNDLSLISNRVEDSTEAAAENFVVVDGSYLNILFHNLSLPEIFSNGKQYEVNEEALNNIVNSSTKEQTALNATEAVEKFMDNIKNSDLDKSSSPSTARSLVEELDQYYKGLTEDDKQADVTEQVGVTERTSCERISENGSLPTVTYGSVVDIFSERNSSSTDNYRDFEEKDCDSLLNAEVEVKAVQTGPLPVPEGAAAPPDPSVLPVSFSPKMLSGSSTSDSFSSIDNSTGSVSSIASPVTLVHGEAEELRRQQLAIEREIKALEQQQNQLLAVREIPDKPPPPYTPPTDVKVPKALNALVVDETIEHQIYRVITEVNKPRTEPSEPFELFVNDFCDETVNKYTVVRTDKPWDSCNLLPQKQQIDKEQLVEKATFELREILSGIGPAVATGVSTRRSDHIDDILFAEWRRCEPEWTSLHVDEATVKNQLFESIFQKILTETINEYKKVVPSTEMSQ